MGAEPVRQPAAQGAKHTGRQSESGGKERCSPTEKPYSDLKYCGIQIDSAVKPPNTIE